MSHPDSFVLIKKVGSQHGCSPFRFFFTDINKGVKITALGLALFLIGCVKNDRALQLPRIPEKTLKEPSSLAFDGRFFYVADWMGKGILKLSLDSKPDWIALETNPIQVTATGPGRLIIEAHDGKLWLWKNQLKEISHEFKRLPGSPFCFDGIYVWFVEDKTAYAAMLLDDASLSHIPDIAYELNTVLIPGAQMQSLACGWNRSVALITHARAKRGQAGLSPEGTIPALAENVLGGGTAFTQKEWHYDGWIPLAVTLTGRRQAAALAENKTKKGSFALLTWN